MMRSRCTTCPIPKSGKTIPREKYAAQTTTERSLGDAGALSADGGAYGLVVKGLVLTDIYVDDTRSRLTGKAAALLMDLANALTTDHTTTLQIEAHCDERGTGSYNLAVGERRGRTIEYFLRELGVPTNKQGGIRHHGL